MFFPVGNKCGEIKEEMSLRNL